MNSIPDAKSSLPLRLIIATSEDVARDLGGANYRSVRLVMDPSTVFDVSGELSPELSGFNEYVILILESQEDLAGRDSRQPGRYPLQMGIRA